MKLRSSSYGGWGPRTQFCDQSRPKSRRLPMLFGRDIIKCAADSKSVLFKNRSAPFVPSFRLTRSPTSIWAGWPATSLLLVATALHSHIFGSSSQLAKGSTITGECIRLLILCRCICISALPQPRPCFYHAHTKNSRRIDHISVWTGLMNLWMGEGEESAKVLQQKII